MVGSGLSGLWLRLGLGIGLVVGGWGLWWGWDSFGVEFENFTSEFRSFIKKYFSAEKKK